MKNKTPERSVDEIVEDFYEQDFIGYSKQHNELTISPTVADWLTQTLQTERQRCEEMVEAERERIKAVVNEIRMSDIEKTEHGYVYKSPDTEKVCMAVFKALTQPLPDKN